MSHGKLMDGMVWCNGSNVFCIFPKQRLVYAVKDCPHRLGIPQKDTKHDKGYATQIWDRCLMFANDNAPQFFNPLATKS